MESTTYTVAPLADKHTHTIILLHGRNSLASEFVQEFFESQVSDGRTLPELFPTIKWVFPASEMRKSTRFETDISQWFDIWSVEEPSEKKEIQMDGLRESIGSILNIVRTEGELVLSRRIFLGGISQGCATAILALLCGGIRLGGFVGVCGWLPLLDDIASVARVSSKWERLQHIRDVFSGASRLPDLSDLCGELALSTPAFLSHSEDDDVVPIKNGLELSETLKDLGLKVKWRAYGDGGHWMNEPQGVDDIVEFLRDNMRIE